MKKLFTLASLFLTIAFSANASEGLTLVGNQLCTESGRPIQLRGWSTHGSWFKYCYDEEEDFAAMKEAGANMARIAMYINEGDGIDVEWVKSCIDFCANQGLYCIVDWHLERESPSISRGNPMTFVGQAKNFFLEIASYVQQKGYNHVLYELCNEPNEDMDGSPYEVGKEYVWDWIKDYCKEILPIIKNVDPDAIVLVGTPQWDRGVVFPFMDPIDEMGLNVMYSFHYYAGNQERYLGLLSSASAFIPLFVTEWSISSDAQGSKDDTKSADKLMEVCNGKNLGGQIISWANWSWSDKNESSSTFRSGSYADKLWSMSGDYVRKLLAYGNNFTFSESSAYEGAQILDGENDLYLQLEKFDEGGNYNAYYDFDEDWVLCSPVPCNAGNAGINGIRESDFVDIGYTNEDDMSNSYYNLGYIAQGEWVKYTIDVKQAGDYEFETYTNNHIDENIIAFTVDGKNALVDEDGNEIYRALELQASLDGDKYEGFHDWDWTTPISPYATDKKFRLRFREAGEHKLGIVFMTSASGLGSLKIKGSPTEIVKANDVNRQIVRIWPNPAQDGTLNISVNYDSNVTIYNVQGVAVFSQNVAAGTTKLNAPLVSGIYYVTIQNEKGFSTEKLSVK
ncbi:MAG: cellulase family glycosylhydrolase [Paludibacteraceae bacterium]|nr:cellulase family glycosylhydrolase [Paludibacteraceae bacterium]